MYATAAFEFNQADNGWLMSEFAFMRSFFLIFLFPRIISWGRRLTLARAAPQPLPEERVCRDDDDDETSALLPTDPGQFDAAAGEQVDEEPMALAKSEAGRDGCLFDLVFLRWSLIVDGALTTVAAFATKRWHIYLGRHTRFLSLSTPLARGDFPWLTLRQPPSCCHLGPGPRRPPKASSPKCAPSRSVPTRSTP